ncbi:MAG TPA: TonB-dependent receptor [Candidatus Binatia bacterium]|nr:TonB-dependent receptor [Candidatus Binatia bacterium]
MRVLAGFFFSLLFFPTALAADLNIKVVDPQSAAVSGAQIALLCGARKKDVVALRATSAEGTATLFAAEIPTSGKTGQKWGTPLADSCQIRVRAAGFAEEIVSVSGEAELKVVLRLATASQTVVVTATRAPVPGEETGTDVEVLIGSQLITMQPTAASDAVRFLPGAIVNDSGQRGGLTSLFVRGGESRYNKVIVDGVTVNEPGGTFDFGTLPLEQADRMEFVRGAQSTLYGSDAMTSVVQVWTRTGSTALPELRFGADGGNFSTAHGYASLAGARGAFDYNLFGSQFNTEGSDINSAFSDSLQGANVGAALGDHASLRLRVRHSNSHTGVPGEWNFNGYVPPVPVNGFSEPYEPLPPNPYDWSQLNSLLGSAELTLAAPNGWQHRFSGFDYLYRYYELNPGDPRRVNTQDCGFGGPSVPCGIDFASNEVDHINRAGFEYQGDHSVRAWAHTTFGYRVENENGFVGNVAYGPQTHGQRLNNDFYVQQQVTWKTLTAIVGGRLVHNSEFGNTGVPRIALTWQALRGGERFSGTRLRFSYSGGFKEPRLEETFAGPPYTQPNPGLKPERLRAFEAGLQQEFFQGKYELSATYFNNLFHDQINYVTVDPITFVGEYVNVNRAFAHGAEVVVRAKLRSSLLLNAAYTYISSQYLDNPAPFDPVYDPGQPLLRRPKHSATTTLAYLGSRWGATLGGSFVDRRSDSDFFGFGFDHAAGYVRADMGGWYAVNSHVTTYVNFENVLDRRYNEVVGYPALPVNFRAGIRFRVGGE